MSVKEFDNIVVGAGIAGIFSALILAEKGQSVLLVDSETQPGGLLRTFTTEDGQQFDYGTHFLSSLNIEGADNLLFSDMNEDRWLKLKTLKSGNVSSGKLYPYSTVIDSRELSTADYHAGICSLLESVANRKEQYADLREQLNSEFGEVFADKLFIPAVEKLFACSASELVAQSHKLFGLGRVIGFSEEAARTLKNLPELGDVLAYHTYNEGGSDYVQYYPKDGGVGLWVESLIAKFKSLGGVTHFGEPIINVEQTDNKVTGLATHSSSFSCENVIWTVPLFGLIKSLKLPVTLAPKPPRFLNTYLVHLIVEKAPQTDCHYYTNYDPNFKHFRTTLYSNVQDSAQSNTYRVTVEVFSKEKLATDAEGDFVSEIMQELKACKVFSHDTQVKSQYLQYLPNSFPVLEHSFIDSLANQRETVEKHCANVHLFGKARGDLFFMRDVLLNVYNTLT